MSVIILLLLSGFISLTVVAQNKVILHTDKAQTQISKHIYGHFAEHLGRCIYGGIYVGENKNIPNTQGVRNDVIQALKELQIPNLRWPGGCFADAYHWKDGIGPKDQRPHTENMAWGNIREDNGFGTHEFLDMCELLGAEPYLAVNMNSGTVQEAVEWVQYTNHANGKSFLTDMREKNGRSTPWNVKYWGIGNESWDCGGDMKAEHYASLYRQFATAMTSYSNTEKLFRIAVGPGSPDYNWTEVVMRDIPLKRIEGLSIHHYSVFDWSKKGHSWQFTDEEYFKTMKQAWKMEEMISKNAEIMDKYDPEKKVALIVDEWGGWYEQDPDGDGILYQQNTIRDAMIAGITLNMFNNHADRVRMANLAQIVNVLQAVILTKDEKMILTPTYHVMEMYKVHQDAILIPLEFKSPEFVFGQEKIQAVSVSASKNAEGKIYFSLTNIDHLKAQVVDIDLKNIKSSSVKGRILTSSKVQDHNSFENPEKVRPELFKDFSLSSQSLKVTLPPNAVVVLELN